MKLMPSYFKIHFTEKDVEATMDQICEKYKSINKPIMFKLKDKHMKEIDLFSMTDPGKRVQIQKYMYEFQKKTFTIINSSSIIKGEFNKTFVSKYYEKFFVLRNFDLILGIVYSLSISSAENEQTLLVYLKLIDYLVNWIEVELEKNEGEQRESVKYIISKLCEKDFLNVEVNEEVMRASVFHLKQRIKALEEGDVDTEKVIVSSSKDLPLKESKENNKSKKDKLAEAFKKKAKTFKTTNNLTEKNTESSHKIKISSENVLELTREKHDCSICHGQLEEKDFFKQPFGRVGVVSKNKLIENSSLQAIRKKYIEEIINKRMKETSTTEYNPNYVIDINTEMIDESLLSKDEEVLLEYILNTHKRKNGNKFNLNLYTCNHFMHFSCYSEYILKYMTSVNNFTSDIVYQCPQCKSYYTFY
jgi:hypothetical protein